MQAYTSVSQAVLRLVDDILGMGDDKGGRWQILLTGHSMGGALSCCCAYELAVKLNLTLVILKYAMHSIQRH